MPIPCPPHSKIRRWPALLAAITPLAAQGVVGPTVTGPIARVNGLNPPLVPASQVTQVQIVRLPTDPPGIWTASLSVEGLAAAWGGRGGRDLLIGRYHALTDSFAPQLDAAACNTPGDEFGGMLDASGRHLVFLRNGRLGHAKRTDSSLPFLGSVPVTNVPIDPIVDPALGMSDGEITLFYRYGAEPNLRRAVYDVSTSTLYGPSLLVATSGRGGTLTSPTPLFGSDGQVTGLLHHDALLGDANLMLATDVDARTSSSTVLDTPGELSHGSHLGGQFVSTENDNTLLPVVVGAPAVWMASAEALIGQPATLQFFVAPSRTDVSISMVLLALQYAGAGIPLPGFRGELGLHPATMLLTEPVGVHTAATGEARFSIPVPYEPSLFGLQVAAQGLTRTNDQAWTFTNTAALRVSQRRPPVLMALPYDGFDHVLRAPIDPGDPALTVKLDGSAPIPIEIVALDLVGQPIGAPVEVLPGWMNTIAESGAARYVARMPVDRGVAQVALTPCDWKPYARGPYCLSTTWWRLELPNKRICVQIQPQTKFGDSQCPVEWRFVSEFRGGTRFVQDQGTLNPATDLYTQLCVEPRDGAAALVLEYRCQGHHTSRCRVTVLVKEVANCADCPRENKVK